MVCEIMYATPCKATVVDSCGDSWDYSTEFKTLKEAIDWTNFVIDDGVGLIQHDAVTCVYITDSITGELLAECHPDDVEEENYDCDWGFNEDEGFDPYMGCYSDDC